MAALAGTPSLETQAATPAPESASLEFIANQGQWAPAVRYEAALPAGRLFVQRTGLTYAFYDPAFLNHHRQGGEGGTASGPIAAHAYTVRFEQARPGVRLTATDRVAGERNYFVGADARRWASHVGAFRQLRYGGLWPGIDLTLYENRTHQLEYDVLLAPRANPDRVALRYDGARALALDAAGNQLVRTTVGTTTELAPRAWQLDAAGQPRPVACRYVLRGHVLRFALDAYDHSRALTIDPTVQFSTLTGSAADNWGFTATYDADGNIYSGGIAFALGFPVTPGAFQTNFAGVADMALIKYNTSANGPAARVWATYLGGSSSDFPHSLVVNSRRELVVLGSSSSRDYPTRSNAAQRGFGGGTALDPFRDGIAPYTMPNGSDLVVSRLSADGSILLASTYLGGSGNDGPVAPSPIIKDNYGDAFRSDVLLDAAGNVYVAATTGSADFPGLSRGFNGLYAGGRSDAVVCQLDPALSTVSWAGLLGGTDDDAAYSLQRDERGRIFVSGATIQLLATASTFPATAGAYQATFQGGGIDGFAARLSADGRRLERATFIGTGSYDRAQLLQLDAQGNVYLFGQTLGAFPIAAGLYGNQGGTLFLQKLDPDLATSFYRTAFGPAAGAPALVPTAFLVDECERVYVSGWGGEVNNQNGKWLGGTVTGLPVAGNPVQPTTDGSDFYLAQFAPGLTGLDYATFFGQRGIPEHVDGGTSRFDPRGVVYQAVCAGCGGAQGFPLPPGANTYTVRNGSSNCNNGAFKMSFEVRQADPGPRRFVCLDAGPVALAGSPAGGTWSGPGVQATAGGGFRFVPAAVGPGQYALSYSVAATGICVSTRHVRYVVAPPLAPTFAPLAPLCTTQAAVGLSAGPAGGTFAGPGVSGGRFDPALAGPGTHTLTYTIVDSLGCGSTSQQVAVTRPPAVVAGPDTTLCADQQLPFQLRGARPAGGTWSGTGVTAAGYFTPPNTNNRGGLFRLTYTVRDGPCQAAASRLVVLAPTSGQNVALELPVCGNFPRYAGLAPFDAHLQPVLRAPHASYVWNFGDRSLPDTAAAPVHRYEHPGIYQISLTARYGNCQVLTGFAPIEVGEVLIPNIITPNGDSLNQTFRPRFSCRPTTLEVYSRWGQLVYRAADYHQTWDGRGLPDGVYYFLLRDDEGRRQKGWVEVRR